MPNINKYIEDYLNNYLKIDNPEFAILLSGKWGSGKTFFIEQYIERYVEKNKDTNIKFIKISLFGLKETDSIDEQIFNSLHSVLGNKYVKLTGSIIKNALKLGVKIDWDSDNKSDGSVKIDAKSFNPLDYFSDKKKSKKELVFIFDDLERTDIKLKEILGYINSLVEQSKFKVIILGSEEKIINKDKEEYREFKEKIIGKTFEIQHEFREVLDLFIEEKTNKAKKYLLEYTHIIESIYKQAKYNNLRHIKQILLEFEFFINLIDNKYLKNKEFMKTLINNFFALSIEIKGGNLTEEELSNYVIWSSLYDNKKEKTNIENIYLNYNIYDTQLFNGKFWADIIFKSSLDGEIINEEISNLSFFIETKENNQETWVKLWHFRQLDNDDFEKTLNDVLERFNNCKYEKQEHFLHVIALLIFFSKEKLCNLTIRDIQEQVNKCIKRYELSKLWKDNILKKGSRFNGTGLAYMNYEDKDFLKIYEQVVTENKKINDKALKEKEKEKFNLFLEKFDDEKYISHLLLEEYQHKAFFQNVSSKDFLSHIKKYRNKDITELRYILYERYENSYYHLTEELPFWEELNKELLKDNKKIENLSQFILKEFNYTVENIIKKLKSCKKNNDDL